MIELAVVRTPFSMDGFEGITLKKDPMMAVGVPSYFESGKIGRESSKENGNCYAREKDDGNENSYKNEKNHGKEENQTRDMISLRELSGHPLILYRRWEEVLRNAFAKEGCEMDVRCKTDDARTALLCTQKGFGIGIMPASIVPMEKEDGTLRVKIDCEELDSSILLLQAKNKTLSGAAEALVQYVTQNAKEEKAEVAEEIWRQKSGERGAV